MIIGIDKLKELISTKNLIEGLDPEHANFEGAGVDIRIGELWELESGQGRLMIETRDSPEYKIVAKYEKEKSTVAKVQPGKTYLAKSIEIINTPEDLLGWLIPRSTWYRAGIAVLGIKTDPGYKGHFSFTLINMSGRDFEVEMGARMASIVFHTVEGKTNPYIGQWQGGRVFIKEEEKQTKQA